MKIAIVIREYHKFGGIYPAPRNTPRVFQKSMKSTSTPPPGSAITKHRSFSIRSRCSALSS